MMSQGVFPWFCGDFDLFSLQQKSEALTCTTVQQKYKVFSVFKVYLGSKKSLHIYFLLWIITVEIVGYCSY